MRPVLFSFWRWRAGVWQVRVPQVHLEELVPQHSHLAAELFNLGAEKGILLFHQIVVVGEQDHWVLLH